MSSVDSLSFSVIVSLAPAIVGEVSVFVGMCLCVC